MSTCSEALRLSQDAGWHLLPVGANKRPIGGVGLASATTNVDTIAGWFEQWPNAGFAVACKPSGLVVVDLDRGHGSTDGIATFEALAGSEPHGASIVASTPRGGRHLFYRCPEGIEIASRTALRPGIDIKAGGGDHGGYVVLPDGRPGREWIEGDPCLDELTEPPAWLLELLPRAGKMPPPPPPPNSDDGAFAGVGEGERHAAACRVAGKLLARGLGEEAWPLLRAWNQTNRPPLPEGELRRVFDDLLRRDRGKGQPPKGETGRDPSISATVASLRKRGALQHEPTGLDYLDDITGGGLVYGSRTYIQGPPDVCKTLLAVQVADAFAQRDIAVGFLSVDEDAEDVLLRLCQRRGATRCECERQAGPEFERALRGAEALPWRFYGPDYTIESAAAELSEWAIRHERRSALFVDSVQTCRCDADDDRQTDTANVNARVRAIRHVATKYRHLVVAIGEVGRAAYRSGDPASQVSDMAAGKQSGAIEYSARLLLTLKSVAGEPDLVELRITKNKFGPRTAEGDRGFYLRLHREAQVVEPDKSYQPPPQNEAAQQRRAEDATKAAAVVADVLAAHPGIGTRELYRATNGRGFGRTRTDNGLGVLETAEAIVRRAGPNSGHRHFLIGERVPEDVFDHLQPGRRGPVLAASPPTEKQVC